MFTKSMKGFPEEDVTESTEHTSSSDLAYEHDLCPKYDMEDSNKDLPSDIDDDTADLMKIVESRARSASRRQNVQPLTAVAPHFLSQEGKTCAPSRKAVLRYLEEEPYGDLEQGIGNEGSESGPQLEQPALRRQHDKKEMEDVQPGAYSGSFGEAYERLEKIQHSSRSLGACACFEDSTDTRTHNTEQDATLSDERAQEDSPKGRTRKMLIVVSLFLVVFLMIAIPLLVKKESLSEDLAQEGGKLDSSGADDADDHGFLSYLTNDTLVALKDPHSIQYIAYDWISRDPNWNSYAEWRKVQRFALMCFFEAIERPSFGGPSYHTHECDWFLDDVCSGGELGVVRFLRVSVSMYQGPGRLRAIPPELSLLSELESLDLLNLRLVANTVDELLPLSTLESFPSIKLLRIQKSGLGGSIPSALGTLTSLSSLDLSNNDITSSIPSELGLLCNLTSLRLTSNRLSGSIPKEIGDLPYLSTFRVEENALMEPKLPPKFCAQDHIPFEYLDADWCSGAMQCCAGQ